MLYELGREFNVYFVLAVARGESTRGCTSACTSLEAFCLFTQDKWSHSSLIELVCDFLRYAAAQTAWPDCHLAEILLSKTRGYAMTGQQLHSAIPQSLIQKAPKMSCSQNHMWTARNLDKQSPALLPICSAPLPPSS